MSIYTDKATRTLKLQKAEKPKIGNGLPPSMDGFEGENRIQMVEGKPRLYYRTNNAWYFTGLSQDGTTPDIPTATSTRLGLIKIGDGGTVSSDGTYTATAATPAADDITGGDAAVTISTSTGNITIDAAANNSNIIFKGTDDTSDITMLTLSGADAGAATFNNKVVATELDISGNADIDGTLEADAITVNGSALNTVIAGITVTNATTAAVATTVTITDNEDTDEENAIIFTAGGDVDGGNLGLESDGHLIYNPSTGALTAHQLKIDSSSTSRIYVANAAGGTTPSIGTSGQAIISYGSSGAPYWGNPIAASNGSEGRIQLSSSSSLITSSSSFGFGALDASPLVLTYAGNMNITGAFEVKNGSTSAGYINFYEDSNNGTNKATLIGPASTADITLTLPSAAGTIIGTGNLTSITTVGTIGTGTWEGTDVAVAHGGTGASSLNNLITLSTHTTGNYVATLTAGALIDLQNNSGEGASPTIDVDLTECDEATIANGDYILFLDGGATGAHRKEALADLVGIMAGDNITASGITLNFAASNFKEADDVETVPLGGTGVDTLTDGGVLLGSGTGAITAMSVLSDGQMIVGDGSGDPVAESGATLRTSIGVGPTAGNTSLVTTGTITTGTWQGTTIAVNQGGTGQTSVTNFKNVLDDETWTFANTVIVNGSRMDVLGDNDRRITFGDIGTPGANSSHNVRGRSDGLYFNAPVTHVFEVNGGAEFTLNGSVALFAGTIRGEADIVAYYSSDPSLKENKKLINNPLDKISQIGGYSFDWKDEAKSKGGDHLIGKDYGVMADEIQSLFPELVNTRSNGIRAVKYDKLVPLLIEGIKELKQELDTIKGIS